MRNASATTMIPFNSKRRRTFQLSNIQAQAPPVMVTHLQQAHCDDWTRQINCRHETSVFHWPSKPPRAQRQKQNQRHCQRQAMPTVLLPQEPHLQARHIRNRKIRNAKSPQPWRQRIRGMLCCTPAKQKSRSQKITGYTLFVFGIHTGYTLWILGIYM